jgi:hypothetical protein
MNEIVIDFADPGSITIEFLAKVPGPELMASARELDVLRRFGSQAVRYCGRTRLSLNSAACRQWR